MLELWSGHGERGSGPLRPLPRAEASAERSSARILVVDDDASILETVTAILAAEGHTVSGAANGREALAIAGSWQPTLVLLDMRMPVMDGWAFARALRETGSRVPIVVMTAAENARRWADEVGAAGYLAKPFDLERLVEVVARFAREPRN